MVHATPLIAALTLVAAVLLGLGAGIVAERMSSQRASLPDSTTRRLAVCAICAVAFCAIALAHGPSPEAAELAAFAAILLYLSLIDLNERLIPNSCIVAALVVRVLYLAFACATGRMGIADVGYYVFSACAIGIALFAMAIVADRVFGSESMGGGDLKLFFVAGLYFGWRQGVFIVVLACVFGLLTGFASARRAAQADSGRLPGASGNAFPFGPAISAACLVAMLVGGHLPAFL